MDDSNKDDKKYAKSHLLCFLEMFTQHNNIEAHHTYLVLDLYLFAAYTFYIHFIEIWVTVMTYYLSDSLLTSLNRFIFTSKQTFIK